MEKNSSLDMAIAKVIREEREKKGLTQGQLAGLSGLSETYISFIEHAHTKLSVNALVQIAAVFSLDASEAMRRIEKEMKKRPAASEEADGPSEEKHQIAATLMHDILFLSHPLNLNKGKPLLCNVKLGNRGKPFLDFQKRYSVYVSPRGKNPTGPAQEG